MKLRTWEVKLILRLPADIETHPEKWNWTFQLQLNPSCGEAAYLEECREATDEYVECAWSEALVKSGALEEGNEEIVSNV